jgi:hypothetical protein
MSGDVDYKPHASEVNITPDYRRAIAGHAAFRPKPRDCIIQITSKEARNKCEERMFLSA